MEFFIISDVQDGIVPGFEDLGIISIQTQFNGPGAKIDGIELALQRGFDFLPGPLADFGTILNFTYVDGELDDGQPVPGISETSYNAVLFYENDKLSARLAYNYRDDYVVFNGLRGVPYYRDSRSQLDFNVQYRVTDALAVIATGRNITDEPTYDYHGDPLNFSAYHKSGAIYSLGARVRF